MTSESDQKEYWFPAKKYGYGWGLPVTWQGWIIFMIYLTLITVGIFLFPISSKAGLLQYSIFTAVLTIVLIAVCWLKGEPPKWRWGNEEHY